MNAIILRRRKLGRGSATGISNVSTKGIKQVRNWKPQDWQGLGGICDPLVVFRWGCTSNIPGDDTASPITVVNSASSIHWCSDKRQGRLDMQAANVPVPQSWDARVFLHDQIEGVGDIQPQYVLRRPKHAQGKDLWHGDGAYIRQMIAAHNTQDGYVSRLIDKVAEYRVMVVQNRAAWVAKKTPGNPEAVAWNVAQGGRFDNVRWESWPIAVVKAALAAAKVSGTDFCGVDVMEDAQGNPYVLEVNSAPSQTSPYRQSCLAKCFDYIIEHGKQHFPDPPVVKTYKSLIHPAVRGKEPA